MRTTQTSETNIGLDNPDSTVPNSEIIGQSRTAVPRPYVDYFSWLKSPKQAQQNGLSIGSADPTGNSGIYYKVSLGSDGKGRPLVDLFSIDAMRLIMNVGGKYPNLTNGFGSKVESSQPDYNLEYDPSLKPTGSNRRFTTAASSNDPSNGWQQFSWLRQELKRSQACWQLVMGHQPVYSSGDGKQPEDNMSFPTLQKFLAGLPDGAFDAYLNGHAHYYQRVLEGNDQGIGRGIPFITMGNSGRLLDSINETRYGDNIYEPRNWSDSLDTYMGVGNKKLTGTSSTGVPYTDTGVRPYLLNSSPTTVGVSGGYLSKDADGTAIGFNSGAYGFGFGGATLKVGNNGLLYRYRQPEVSDPAITENLDPSTRLGALQGWDGLTVDDWRPRDPLTGQPSPELANTAQIQLLFEPGDNGQVSSVSLINGGSGYMASRDGRHSVDFAIRGNDAVTGNPLNPNDEAIVRLSFADGVLVSADLRNDGSGYGYLGQLMQSDSFGATIPFTEPQQAVVPINSSWMEPWYGQANSNYQDSYLITKTRARAVLRHSSDRQPELDVQIVGKDRQSRRWLKQLSSSESWTTGYSGDGPERAYRTAQMGRIRVKDESGRLLGQGQLENGVARIGLQQRPADGDLQILFGGDTSSSYLVNYRASSTWVGL